MTCLPDEYPRNPCVDDLRLVTCIWTVRRDPSALMGFLTRATCLLMKLWKALPKMRRQNSGLWCVARNVIVRRQGQRLELMMMTTPEMGGHRITVSVEPFYGGKSKHPHEVGNVTAKLNRPRAMARKVAPRPLEDLLSVVPGRKEARELCPTRLVRYRWRIPVYPKTPSVTAAGLVTSGRLMVFNTRSATMASSCASPWSRRPGISTIW